ncbi:UNVERIFIED_CONTAM: hypothetical protein FKN15_045660 [Acipenser sinensis]
MSRERRPAAQEGWMRKLEEWRQARGRSYQCPPQKQPPTNPLSHRHSFWTAIVEEDNINSLVTSVESTLTDCLRLEQEACPAEQGNREMMLLFKEAVEEFQTLLFEILKRRFRTEKDSSSVVKYRITATVGGKDACRSEPLILEGQELHFFTLVCRSVQIELLLLSSAPCAAGPRPLRDLLPAAAGAGGAGGGRGQCLCTERMMRCKGRYTEEEGEEWEDDGESQLL